MRRCYCASGIRAGGNLNAELTIIVESVAERDDKALRTVIDCFRRRRPSSTFRARWNYPNPVGFLPMICLSLWRVVHNPACLFGQLIGVFLEGLLVERINLSCL